MTDPSEEAKMRQEVGGGALSNGQIEFLVDGPGDLSQSAVRHRRQKARDNYQSAIADLALLLNLEDRDLIRSLGPVLGDETTGDIADGMQELGLMDKQEASHIDTASTDTDPRQRDAMEEGVLTLLAALTYFLGPEHVAAIAERGINTGMAEFGKVMQESPDIYNLRLEPADLSEKFEEQLDDSGE